MNLREHLVYHLQELYAFERDYMALLSEMAHAATDAPLGERLHAEREGMRSDLEILERSLNLLSAQYKQERNAVVPGLKEAFQRFLHQTNPSPEHRNVHGALDTLKVGEFIQAAYQGDIELARAIGEPDVALLLEENVQRQRQSLDALRRYLTQLITAVGRSEAQEAA